MDQPAEARHQRSSLTELPWTTPPHLLPFERHTLYPGRAEELINSDATFFNNAVVASMRAETHAEWRLLERLHAIGALKEDFV